LKQVADIFQVLSKNPYIRIVLAVAGTIFLAQVVEWVVLFYNRKRGREIRLNFLSETRFVRRLLIIGVLLSVIVSLDYFHISEHSRQIAEKSMITVILCFCWRIASGAFRVFLNKIIYSFTLRNLVQLKRKNFIEVIDKTTNIAILIICSVIALNVWGVQVGPLLTGLGIAGVAIGLALQDMLTNIFGGISLSLDDVIREDEMIELATGEIGIVYQIGYRSTKIKTFNEEIIVVPNNKLTQTNIRNYSRPTLSYRLSLPVVLEYGCDLDSVKALFLEILRETEGVLDFPEPDVSLERFGENGLEFRLFAQIQTPLEKGRIIDRILSRTYRALRKDRIGIAQPFRNITVSTKEKLSGQGQEAFEAFGISGESGK
jgi:MscS family membrane protein